MSARLIGVDLPGVSIYIEDISTDLHRAIEGAEHAESPWVLRISNATL
jgi:hypothetical protein